MAKSGGSVKKAPSAIERLSSLSKAAGGNILTQSEQQLSARLNELTVIHNDLSMKLNHGNPLENPLELDNLSELSVAIYDLRALLKLIELDKEADKDLSTSPYIRDLGIHEKDLPQNVSKTQAEELARLLRKKEIEGGGVGSILNQILDGFDEGQQSQLKALISKDPGEGGYNQLQVRMLTGQYVPAGVEDLGDFINAKKSSIKSGEPLSFTYLMYPNESYAKGNEEGYDSNHYASVRLENKDGRIVLSWYDSNGVEIPEKIKNQIVTKLGIKAESLDIQYIDKEGDVVTEKQVKSGEKTLLRTQLPGNSDCGPQSILATRAFDACGGNPDALKKCFLAIAHTENADIAKGHKSSLSTREYFLEKLQNFEGYQQKKAKDGASKDGVGQLLAELQIMDQLSEKRVAVNPKNAHQALIQEAALEILKSSQECMKALEKSKSVFSSLSEEDKEVLAQAQKLASSHLGGNNPSQIGTQTKRKESESTTSLGGAKSGFVGRFATRPTEDKSPPRQVEV